MAYELETYRGAVYPWHCDTMGHMNTQFYAVIFDAAGFQFLSPVSRGLEASNEKRGWADVKLSTEFKHEVRAGTLVHVRSSLTRIGTKSIEYRHSLLNSETGELHATCEAVTVRFDLIARKAVALEDTVRARLKSWETNGKSP